MKRKTFLINTAITVALVSQRKILGEDSMEKSTTWEKEWQQCETLTDLASFFKKWQPKLDSAKVEGSWSLGEVLSHCAQSIEMSMQGYPDMKPALFRGTIGKTAFFVFSSRKKMSHNLEDPIPGAPPLLQDTKVSIQRLLNSIELFQNCKEEDLKPHFAYGELKKDEYSLAHLMHIKNHLEKVNVANS